MGCDNHRTQGDSKCNISVAVPTPTKQLLQTQSLKWKWVRNVDLVRWRSCLLPFHVKIALPMPILPTQRKLQSPSGGLWWISPLPPRYSSSEYPTAILPQLHLRRHTYSWRLNFLLIRYKQSPAKILPILGEDTVGRLWSSEINMITTRQAFHIRFQVGSHMQGIYRSCNPGKAGIVLRF